jgi:hypothetical protein
VDASKETHVALAARLGIVPPTLNTKKGRTSKSVMHSVAGSLLFKDPG